MTSIFVSIAGETPERVRKALADTYSKVDVNAHGVPRLSRPESGRKRPQRWKRQRQLQRLWFSLSLSLTTVSYSKYIALWIQRASIKTTLNIAESSTMEPFATWIPEPTGSSSSRIVPAVGWVTLVLCTAVIAGL